MSMTLNGWLATMNQNDDKILFAFYISVSIINLEEVKENNSNQGNDYLLNS